MAQQALIEALFKLLRPLIRILLRHGVPVTVFEDVARRVYVDVAFHDFQMAGRKQSVSRIGVLTGLNRKEVARLRAIPESDVVAEEQLNRAERVLTAWIREPAYLDEKGDAKVLAFDGTGSFSELVRKYSGDMPPRAVADELIRIGNVERDSEGHLRLLSRGYFPKGRSDEALFIFGTHARDMLETFDHNLNVEADDRLFQREVAYHTIPVHLAEDFRTMSARWAQQTLEELDHWLAEHKTEDQEEPVMRLGLGIYQFESHPEQTE